jgi:hypothetical protein
MTASDALQQGIASSLPQDARQSAIALEVQRGVTRLLLQHGLASVTELSLPNGRRADVAGLTEKGDIWIVEIKSCLADFRADHKWVDYRDYCDRLFFAVTTDFPREVLPEDAGLILADRYGGELVRAAPEMRLAAARRKAMTLAIARASAFRVSCLYDPTLTTLRLPDQGSGG